MAGYMSGILLSMKPQCTSEQSPLSIVKANEAWRRDCLYYLHINSTYPVITWQDWRNNLLLDSMSCVVTLSACEASCCSLMSSRTSTYKASSCMFQDPQMSEEMFFF